MKKYLPLPVLPMRTICGFACGVAIHAVLVENVVHTRLVSSVISELATCRPFRVQGRLYSSSLW